MNKYSVSKMDYRRFTEIMNETPYGYFVGAVFYTEEKPSYDIVLLNLSSIPLVECAFKNKTVDMYDCDTFSISKYRKLKLPVLSNEEELVVKNLISFLEQATEPMFHRIKKLISYLAIEKKFETEFKRKDINVFPELFNVSSYEDFKSMLHDPDSQLRNRPMLAAVRVPKSKKYLEKYIPYR